MKDNQTIKEILSTLQDLVNRVGTCSNPLWLKQEIQKNINTWKIWVQTKEENQ